MLRTYYAQGTILEIFAADIELHREDKTDHRVVGSWVTVLNEFLK